MLTKGKKHEKMYLIKDIGCLMHALACTRLDTSFVVGQVDKFQGMFPTFNIVIGQMHIQIFKDI
jgi:hypothetical protein